MTSHATILLLVARLLNWIVGTPDGPCSHNECQQQNIPCAGVADNVLLYGLHRLVAYYVWAPLQDVTSIWLGTH